jgi:hypothetical protein
MDPALFQLDPKFPGRNGVVGMLNKSSKEARI